MRGNYEWKLLQEIVSRKNVGITGILAYPKKLERQQNFKRWKVKYLNEIYYLFLMNTFNVMLGSNSIPMKHYAH